MYNTDGGQTASTIYTITAVPDWVENEHLTDSEHSITVVQIGGAPISAGSKALIIKSLEAEAYANYFLFTAEDLMSDVTHAMFPRPELIYIYTQMDYEQQEGNNKPIRIPEMILQVRMRLQHGILTSAGPATVQRIHDRLGIAAPVYSVAWMVNGIKLEMLGSQASRSNPPHGIFYSAPGGPKPLPHVVIRDISANFYRRAILVTLPPEVLNAMAGYI